MTEFHHLKTCLAEWPRTAPPNAPLADHACERLRSVLHQLWNEKADIGKSDLAGLIQHVVRRQHLLAPNADIWKVPRGDHWPDAGHWRSAGLSVVAEKVDSITLRDDRPWAPSWLPGSDRVSPLQAAILETRRRQPMSEASLDLDPAIASGCGLSQEFQTYSCPGQQQAIHAAMFLKPGGTLAVNLPTGSGKSLVAWAAAMLAPAGMLTVVIVPTVALALDQERQMFSLFVNRPRGGLPERLTWHGALSEEEKVSIRQNVRDGAQRILFTSPETVTGSLCRELYAAAKQGRLAYFVIDEAHLVAQWGTEFRPEFQSMAGLRRELIDCCPDVERRVRTLLLSATLTQESFDVLQELFSEDGFEVVSAVHLRPEPEYWMSRAASDVEQVERVEELVRVVPRPFLLYVTERDDAREWTRRLKAWGYTRMGCVHGGTDASERRRVIDDWRANRIDFVVATSAFGVGMDKADVRAVIHVCAPETVDRLYQEVGRGGRDGNACVSFVVYTEEDLGTASGIGTKCFISVERGLERWCGMIDAAKRDKDRDGLLRVDLTTLPADKSQESPANRAWNLRTLLLLHRAGLIRLENVAPPEIHAVDNESDLHRDQRRQAANEEYQRSSFVRIQCNTHRDQATWEKLVEPFRLSSFERDRRSFEDLCEVLAGRSEVGQVLTRAYSAAGTWGIAAPVKVCGGCPVCRDLDLTRTCRPPRCGPLETPHAPTSDRISALMANTENGLLFVACSGEADRVTRRIQRDVLPLLVQSGIAEVAVPDGWSSQRICRELFQRTPRSFVIHRASGDYDVRRDQIRVPRVSVLDPDHDGPFDPSLLHIERPIHIVLCSERITTRDRPADRFFDRASHISLEMLLEVLQS